MNHIEILGFVAGTICSLSGFPQIYHCITTKDVSSLSLYMLIVNQVGFVLYFVYGVLIGHIAIWVSILVSISSNTTLLILKWKYNKNKGYNGYNDSGYDDSGYDDESLKLVHFASNTSD